MDSKLAYQLGRAAGMLKTAGRGLAARPEVTRPLRDLERKLQLLLPEDKFHSPTPFKGDMGMSLTDKAQLFASLVDLLVNKPTDTWTIPLLRKAF